MILSLVPFIINNLIILLFWRKNHWFLPLRHIEVQLYYWSSYGSSLSWLYDSWNYNYLCNQCLSSLTLWVRIPLKRGMLNTTLCDKVCQWLAAGQWVSVGPPISSTNKIDCQDITERVRMEGIYWSMKN
jgi:hypothetical protein